MVEPLFQIYKGLPMRWNTGARLNKNQRSACVVRIYFLCISPAIGKTWELGTSHFEKIAFQYVKNGTTIIRKFFHLFLAYFAQY